MNAEEFAEYVRSEPALLEPLEQVMEVGEKRQYIVAETAVLLTLLPLLRFVVKEIGLPWMHEVARYSNLWRLKMDAWIDAQYKQQGFDPDKAERQIEKLRTELMRITDKKDQAVWEKLAKKLIEGSDKGKDAQTDADEQDMSDESDDKSS